jgi:threonyl-tRNA synthetase
MQILFIHADRFEWEALERTKYAVDVPEEGRKGVSEEVLVAFTAVERRDEGDPRAVVVEASRQIQEVRDTVQAERVVLYPYAHLSPDLARPSKAVEILDSLAASLRDAGLEVDYSPFGWYKRFDIACKGHPLSELSREITAEGAAEAVSKAVAAEKELASSWFILEPDGSLHPIAIEDGAVRGYEFAGQPNLERFALYEMAKSREAKEEAPHIRLMQDLELVGYEPGSDPGNFRFYPKGRLVKGLLEDYVSRKTVEYGGMEMESPIMYDYEHPSLKSYLDRFPARQYTVETPNKRTFLRFSACFGQFLMAHDMTLSYRDLPARLYELTRYSFRAEQRGELSGLRRLRAFTMPDCHAFVADMEMAKDEMVTRWDLSFDVLSGIGFDLPSELEVGMRATRETWDEHQDFVKGLAKRWGRPILLELWDEQFFYFVLKYEWNFVDALGKAAALNTDQIDVENAERYDITYVDADGKERHPLILHLSPSGAIERVIYALLEKAHYDKEAGKPPMLPVWLSPTQVRVVPVTDDQIPRALEVADELAGFRVDVDDTSDTVGKKIRRAEKEWIPYIAVVGPREMDAGTVNVRTRKPAGQEELTVDALRGRLSEDMEGKPFRPLPLPRRVSRRPSFR